MSIEVSGAKELSADLTAALARMPAEARALTVANGEHLRDLWRSNATASAGHHGKRYPASITSESVVAFAAAVVDVGPDSSKPQGGMGKGFEYGGVNQPPHLDGKRAADVVEPKFVSELEALAAGIL